MMTVIIAVSVPLGVILYTLAVRQRDLPEALPESPITALDERKRAIYENLRDLQFEYRVGKLSDEDYRRTKQGFQRELAGVLAKIDRVLAAGPPMQPQLRGTGGRR